MNQLEEPSTELQVEENDRKQRLAQYRDSSAWKSTWQLASSLLLFCALWTLMYFSLNVSYWLTLLLSLPTAGLLVRLFVLQHDCGHGAFFKSKATNDIVGFMLGILVLTPYSSWRRHHALHHASAGDLDRRGHGDVYTLTVNEYLKLSRLKQLGYRMFRNPVVQFGIAPLVYFAVLQRFTINVPRSWTRERAGIYWTNALVLAAGLGIVWLVGFWSFVLVHLPVLFLATSAGVWLFFVQHTFEDAYWERHDDWDFELAGSAGSTYYQLPASLQWFTGNIGFHHIHHLDSRIPNYRLQECFDQNTDLQQVKRFTIWQSLSCVRFKLFDEESGRMVGFRNLNARNAAATSAKP